MTTDSPGDWRDLNRQLNAEQIEEIEASELDDELRLSWARRLATSNLLQARFADVPAPTECAEEPWPWEDNEDGRYGRLFSVSSRIVIPGADGMTGAVGVGGQQFSDGTVQRWVETSGPMIDAMTADQARDVAAALLAAADELDRLNKQD